jgi:hypothetical protein
MPKKRYNAEEIVHKLREADVLLSPGQSVSQACESGSGDDSTRGVLLVIVALDLSAGRVNTGVLLLLDAAPFRPCRTASESV